jgi:hypothetical protein
MSPDNPIKDEISDATLSILEKGLSAVATERYRSSINLFANLEQVLTGTRPENNEGKVYPLLQRLVEPTNSGANSMDVTERTKFMVDMGQLALNLAGQANIDRMTEGKFLGSLQKAFAMRILNATSKLSVEQYPEETVLLKKFIQEKDFPGIVKTVGESAIKRTNSNQVNQNWELISFNEWFDKQYKQSEAPVSSQ